MATQIALSNINTETERKRREIREQIVARLSDKEYRDIFVSEQINTGLAFQIREMREQRGWTQSELGKKTGMAQSRISVMEDANYSRFSLSTLKRLASAFDVALVVRFDPFSNLVDHFVNLDSSSLNVPSFGDDIFSVEPSLPKNFANPTMYTIEGFVPANWQPVQGHMNTYRMESLTVTGPPRFYPLHGSTLFSLKSAGVTAAKPEPIAAD